MAGLATVEYDELTLIYSIIVSSVGSLFAVSLLESARRFDKISGRSSVQQWLSNSYDAQRPKEYLNFDILLAACITTLGTVIALHLMGMSAMRIKDHENLSVDVGYNVWLIILFASIGNLFIYGGYMVMLNDHQWKRYDEPLLRQQLGDTVSLVALAKGVMYNSKLAIFAGFLFSCGAAMLHYGAIFSMRFRGTMEIDFGIRIGSMVACTFAMYFEMLILFRALPLMPTKSLRVVASIYLTLSIAVLHYLDVVGVQFIITETPGGYKKKRDTIDDVIMYHVVDLGLLFCATVFALHSLHTDESRHQNDVESDNINAELRERVRLQKIQLKAAFREKVMQDRELQMIRLLRPRSNFFVRVDHKNASIASADQMVLLSTLFGQTAASLQTANRLQRPPTLTDLLSSHFLTELLKDCMPDSLDNIYFLTDHNFLKKFFRSATKQLHRTGAISPSVASASTVVTISAFDRERSYGKDSSTVTLSSLDSKQSPGESGKISSIQDFGCPLSYLMNTYVADNAPRKLQIREQTRIDCLRRLPRAIRDFSVTSSLANFKVFAAVYEENYAALQTKVSSFLKSPKGELVGSLYHYAHMSDDHEAWYSN